jgi:hypothetical protein
MPKSAQDLGEVLVPVKVELGYPISRSPKRHNENRHQGRRKEKKKRGKVKKDPCGILSRFKRKHNSIHAAEAEAALPYHCVAPHRTALHRSALHCTAPLSISGE